MKKQGPAKKRAMERLQETMAKMRTPSDRIQIFRTFREETMVKVVNMRFLLGGSIAMYGLYFLFMGRKTEMTKYQFALSRRASQVTGFLTNCPLPPYVRKYVYLGFGKLYGVNFDEVKVEDINQFRTFNQFFTREIKDDVRTIENEQDQKTLSSPCDGKVLSFGDVDSLKSTMSCIKGHTYRLDEFLFGYKVDRDQDSPQATMTESIIQSAKARGNKVMFAVIYLAPQDYHRYHSPAHFTANYRRHIVGYLEPVRPDYLLKHKDVLKDNERVNLLGEWSHGFFTMSFIGALNVGSIKLLFDDQLRTNIKSPKEPYFTDRNYQTLNEAGGSFLTFPVRNRKNIDEQIQEEPLSIAKYLREFDIKDLPIDLSAKQTSFTYDPSLENKLQHNLLNGFHKPSDSQAGSLSPQEQEHKELISKLESPMDSTGSAVKRFSITPQGVLLRKGEQIGMFEMGSTIALILECPPDYEFKFKEGQKLKMGEEILSSSTRTAAEATSTI